MEIPKIEIQEMILFYDIKTLSFSKACLIFLVSIFLTSIGSEGRVQILKPYHPYYIKSGSTLQLTCNSTDRRKLEWLHQTPDEQWLEKVIDPHTQPDFKIRYTIEEPTGFVDSILLKRRVSLMDRGMYKCRDISRETAYSIWVTVLQISSVNVTAGKGDSVTLQCTISGFDQNPPQFEFAWYYDELFIPRDHPHYFMTSPTENSVTLKINNPVKKDVGLYNCVFIFATTLGPLELTHGTYLLDSDDLTSSASKITIPSSSLMPLLFLLTILLSLR